MHFNDSRKLKMMLNTGVKYKYLRISHTQKLAFSQGGAYVWVHHLNCYFNWCTFNRFKQIRCHNVSRYDECLVL